MAFSSLREYFELGELQTTRRDMFPLQMILRGRRRAAANDLRGPLGGPLRWFPSLSLREPSSS